MGMLATQLRDTERIPNLVYDGIWKGEQIVFGRSDPVHLYFAVPPVSHASLCIKSDT